MVRATFKKFSIALIGSAIFGVAGCGGDESRSGAGENASAGDTSEGSAAVNPGKELRDLIDTHAQTVLRAQPELATLLGVSEEIAGDGYNGRLGEYGFAGNDKARQANEQFLQDIRSIDRARLNEQAKITYDVLRDAYETAARRNQFDFGGAVIWGSASPYVVTQLTGPHLLLPRILQTQQPMNTAEDAEHYLGRLAEFGRAFDEVIETVGGDAALGVTPPAFAIDRAVSNMRAFVSAPPAENPLVTTFEAKLNTIEGLSEETRRAMTARAVQLVETVVYPAYARLSAAMQNLSPQAGGDAGLWRLGDIGGEFYQHALDSYGAGGRSGEEIHRIGLAEVARITGEMDAILKAQGLTEGSVAERFEAIGARPDMRYPNSDEGREALLNDLNAQTAEVMAKAPEWFATLPRQEVEVRRIPIYEQDSSPGGYYSSPSLDGERPGIFWINLKDTADWPKHTLKALTYHEAVPGHHFQRSLERAAGLPLMRNLLGYSEFAEGWALYAEQVAAEMGMFDNDPLGNLGRLQSELFRAARLVVDTGLHDKQWTREQAIDYMQSVTGSTRATATREIERYAVWPGQATSYKLGMLKINELRDNAAAALGDEFDIKEFHDVVLLTGAMPLPVLERKIDAWIKSKQ